MIIYKVTNKINGKSYIGQTIKELKVRKAQHLYSALKSNKPKGHFHRALKKYKPKNFIWKILRECDSLEELNMYEADYIGLYNTYNCGYNSTYGGDSHSGYKHNKKKKRKQKRKKQKKSKPVIIEGKRFRSMEEAAEFVGMSPTSVSYRVYNHHLRYRHWCLTSSTDYFLKINTC